MGGIDCGADQNGISELRLIQISVTNNSKIYNLNHMKDSLKILICGHYIPYKKRIYYCLSPWILYENTNPFESKEILRQLNIIGDKVICELRLNILITFNSKNIKNINHMKKSLRILDCGGDMCNIDQNGISELSLIELNAYNNSKIKDVNHMGKTLKILDCGTNCGIDQNRILKVHLIELNASSNSKIKDVNRMEKSLKILGCSLNCGISQKDIIKLKLEQINTRYNDKFRVLL